MEPEDPDDSSWWLDKLENDTKFSDAAAGKLSVPMRLPLIKTSLEHGNFDEKNKLQKFLKGIYAKNNSSELSSSSAPSSPPSLPADTLPLPSSSSDTSSVDSSSPTSPSTSIPSSSSSSSDTLDSSSPTSPSTFIGFYCSKPFWPTSDPLHLPPPDLKPFEIKFEKANQLCTIRISIDGMIQIFLPNLPRPKEHDIDGDVTYLAQYLKYLNCFALLLDCVVSHNHIDYFHFHEIIPRDLIFVNIHPTQSHNFPLESIGSKYLETTYDDIAKGPPIIVPETMLSEVWEIFQRALSTPHDLQLSLIEILSTFAKGLSEYKNGNYEHSIVITWTLIEKVLNFLWEGFLSKHSEFLSSPNGKKRINSERMAKLTGRDYSASVISNFLELSNEITFEQLEEMDQVRRNRNHIAHSIKNYTPTRSDSKQALELAQNLIQTKFEIDFTPNYSCQRSL